MDNLFITQHFDWNRPASWKVRWGNRFLSACRLKARLVSPHSTGVQTSVEQRINLYCLARQVLDCDVPGEFVEIGSYLGSTAALLQEVLGKQGKSRSLHLYDAFLASGPETLLKNFETLKLPAPVVHVGLFEETLPTQLPGLIAFAHLDVNWGQSFEDHRDIITHCLSSLYPRMAPGGICVIADYCILDIYERQGFSRPWMVALSKQWSMYPAVRAACDTFLADKPETITVLYGGPFSHGFFRKQMAETKSEGGP